MNDHVIDALVCAAGTFRMKSNPAMQNLPKKAFNYPKSFDAFGKPAVLFYRSNGQVKAEACKAYMSTSEAQKLGCRVIRRDYKGNFAVYNHEMAAWTGVHPEKVDADILLASALIE